MLTLNSLLIDNPVSQLVKLKCTREHGEQEQREAQTHRRGHTQDGAMSQKDSLVEYWVTVTP